MVQPTFRFLVEDLKQIFVHLNCFGDKIKRTNHDIEKCHGLKVKSVHRHRSGDLQ